MACGMCYTVLDQNGEDGNFKEFVFCKYCHTQWILISSQFIEVNKEKTEHKDLEIVFTDGILLITS